ncbi:MAG: putative sulfate exporter family transporter, partial [Brachymonas sp.]|nr:putative sulfate exporter family transporter [Brachymonas sp.]
AAKAAVITKMVRVMLLGPFLLLLSWWQTRGGVVADADQTDQTAAPHSPARPGVPWFVWAFAVCVALRSAIDWPASAVQTIIAWDNALLAMAMAALGLGTQLRAVVRAGTKPLALAAVLWLWLMGAGAAMHLLLGKLLGL